jgi:hypothetical protein
MIFLKECSEKKNPSLVGKIRSFEWNSQKTIYRRVWNYGKQFYLPMQVNIMHLDQMDVIMCEENSGKNFGKTIV